MKAARSRKRRLFLIANKFVSVITLFFFSAGYVFALPAGQQVVNGQASFATQGNNLTITNSPNSIINWQGFSINSNEAVRFIQQYGSSAVLNRVIGQDPSRILGLLQSNGRVFLINPSGILFGQGARIDVNGLFASTLNISNQDFLAGKYNFTTGAFAGSIQNQGTITTPEGGKVYLIAPDIENSGIINSPKGDVILAAGHSVQLVDSLNPDISIVVSAPENRAVNLGQIVAQSGKVGIYGGLISQRGIINADSAVSEGGRIFLKATKAIELADTSVISADGTKGGQIIAMTAEDGQISGTLTGRGLLSAQGDGSRGSGGFIETSAAKVDLNGIRVRTNGGNWLIDPYDFTIAADKTGTVTGGTPSGDISGAMLSTALDSGSVTILSSQGSTVSGSGDINVNDAVSWEANALTLTAARDISINAVMTATASGTPTPALVMNTATSNGGQAGVTGGTVKVGFNPDGSFKGRVDFFLADGTTPRSGTGFLTINGAGYTVITSLGAQGSNTGSDLQGMNGNLSRKYALGGNIDASPTSTFNSGAGFEPVSTFTGIFDGLGHTITGLKINLPTTDGYVGLFGDTNSSAIVRNVGLVVNITGKHNTGGVVGYNSGTISNSYSTGEVTGKGVGTAIDTGEVGGLVGDNASTGIITNSYSTATVTGTVTGTANTGTSGVGGLVGVNDNGKISNSYHSTGEVKGETSVGGLVGENYGASSSIINSYSTGTVIGTTKVGGLVGYNSGSISYAYSVGAVTGNSYVGGLVGTNSGSISNSYSAGAVTGTTNKGGLAGGNSGTISKSYWDKDTSGQSNSAGEGVGAATSLTTALMKKQSSFDWGGDIVGSGGTSAVWRIYEDNTYPLLRSFLTPATVTAKDDSKTYNGLEYTSGNGVTCSTGTCDAKYEGTLAYSGNSQGAKNAGPYVITPSGYYSNQQGYDISFANGALTVNKAALTITAATNTKGYDGGVTAAAIPIVSGTQLGDTVTGLAEVYADRNAATGKTLNVSAYTVNDGNSGNNYTVSTVADATGVISKAPLTITAATNTRVYDGGITAAATPTVAGIQSGDSITGLVEAYADRNAATGKTLNVSAYTVNDGNSGNNYTVSTVADATGVISKAPLTITAATNTRVYDGGITAAATPTVAGIQSGDSITGLVEAYADKNAATGKTLNVSAYTVNDGNSGNNYTVSTVADTTGVISKAPLTITAATNTRVYDGGITAAATPTVTGIQSGDSITGLVEAYADRNAATGKTLNVSAYTVNDGNSGNNYTVSTVADTTGVISKAPLTITAATNTRVYDGGITAAATPTVTGIQSGDSITGLVEAYADRNAATGKTLNVSAYTVNDGNSGNNYTVSTVADTTGVISKAPLTITAATNTKTYDGGVTAAATPTIAGIQSGDTVTGLAEAYADKNATTGKTLNVSAYTVNDGNSGNNYTVTTVADTTGVISKAPLTTSGAVAQSKVYDATTAATINGETLVGVISGDNVNVSGGGTFADKNVAAGKVVTAALALSGTDSDNYSLSQPSGLTADITARGITVTAATNTKGYDRTTSAAAAPTITSGSLVGGDAATLSEVYDSKTAGTGKTLTPSAVISDGNSGNNYKVEYVNNTTGVIDPGQIVSGKIDVATAGKTIDFAVNGTLLGFDANGTFLPDQASTDASGNYSLMVPLNSIPNNSALLAYVANDSSVKSASVYFAAGGDIANLLLSSNTVTASSGGTMSNTIFGNAKGALSSSDIPYSVSGNNLTLSSGFNLAMNTGGDMTLNGLIDAGTGNVALKSGGAIINGMGGARSINAASLAAEAVNGIGSGDPLMTGVNKLAALNTATNNIQIDNTGVLTVSDLRNLGTGNVILQNIGAITTETSTVTSTGGNVSITAHSPLTIGSGGVSAFGSITLAASPSGGSDNLTINGKIASSGGSIVLKAGTSVVLGPASSLSAPKGTVIVTDQMNTPGSDTGAATGNTDAANNTIVALKTTEGTTIASVETTSESDKKDKEDEEDKKKNKEGEKKVTDDKKKDDDTKKYCN